MMSQIVSSRCFWLLATSQLGNAVSLSIPQYLAYVGIYLYMNTLIGTKAYVLVITRPGRMLLIYKHEPRGRSPEGEARGRVLTEVCRLVVHRRGQMGSGSQELN